MQVCQTPSVVGFIGAASYNQLARVSLPAFIDLLKQAGLDYVYGKRPPDEWGESRFPEHEKMVSVRVPGASRPAQLFCCTLEDPSSIRGYSFGYAWLDEARDMKAEAFDVVNSRLRGQPDGTNYRTLITTTPNGFGWLYKKFVSEPIPSSAIVQSPTAENIYLPPGFIDNLRAQYTSQYAKQELEGQFLNLTAGQAYYAFKRTDHVANVKINPMLPLWYSIDLNVSPLCSVYGTHTKLMAEVAGEIYIAGSGRTSDATEEFCRRMKDHQNKTVVIFGDMSGANSSTRGDQTDYDVIQQVLRANGWQCEVRRNYVNPPFVESIESVNAMFEHMRLTVDPDCKRLIADLEQVSWQEGTRVIDKKNKDLTHLSDAFRYFVFKEFSVKQQASSSSILN